MSIAVIYFEMSRIIFNIERNINGERFMDQTKIYGTSWCPDCARAKQVFTKLKISFEWIDIDHDKKAAAYVENINGGFKSVPTIVFPDNSVLVEPSNVDLEKKLLSLKT
jgi:mycoredoxin